MLETQAPPQLETPPLERVADAPRWRAATRIAFRFCFLYFGLYVLTTQMLGGLWIIPKIQPPDMGATGWMKRRIAWLASHLFHVTWQYSKTSTGSGDKTIDWIHAFCLVVFSAAATIVWSAIDRRRPNYSSLHKWFHVFLRFAAATTMAGYGMVKFVPLQMPAPTLTRLLEPYGNFSPMGVLWYSVGASFPYERFAGVMELTAAVLLFVPRLSTLGAMVLVADAVQIFTLNMTYDIPVKLFAFHLIVIGVVLLAPDMRRLFGLLVLNHPAGPSTMPPLARGVTTRRVLTAAQIVVGAYVLGSGYIDARDGYYRFGRRRAEAAALRHLERREDAGRRRRAGAARDRLGTVAPHRHSDADRDQLRAHGRHVRHLRRDRRQQCKVDRGDQAVRQKLEGTLRVPAARARRARARRRHGRPQGAVGDAAVRQEPFPARQPRLPLDSGKPLQSLARLMWNSGYRVIGRPL